MVLKKQDKDYNCGVYALDFLLRINGIKYYIPTLEILLETNEKNGTSHENIFSFLASKDIRFNYSYNNRSANLSYPCLVNYQHDNDGHYGVALCKTGAGLVIYNPYTGGIDTESDFDKIFFSKRYGKGFYLTIDNGKSKST